MQSILAAVYAPDRDLVRNLVLRDRVKYFGLGLVGGFFGTLVLLGALAVANP